MLETLPARPNLERVPDIFLPPDYSLELLGRGADSDVYSLVWRNPDYLTTLPGREPPHIERALYRQASSWILKVATGPYDLETGKRLGTSCEFDAVSARNYSDYQALRYGVLRHFLGEEIVPTTRFFQCDVDGAVKPCTIQRERPGWEFLHMSTKEKESAAFLGALSVFADRLKVMYATMYEAGLGKDFLRLRTQDVGPYPRHVFSLRGHHSEDIALNYVIDRGCPSSPNILIDTGSDPTIEEPDQFGLYIVDYGSGVWTQQLQDQVDYLKSRRPAV